MFSFLAYFVPGKKWIIIGLAALVAISALVGGVMYIKHMWVESEIAQRSYERTLEQLNAVTKELEREQARRERENKRVDEAETEAEKSDDGDDVAPESIRDFLDRLYNRRSDAVSASP